MYNLKQLEEIRSKIGLKDGSLLSLFAVDSTTGYVYFCTSDNSLIGFSPSESRLLFNLSLTKDDLIQEDAIVVDMQYVPDLESVIIATREGDIISYSTTSKEAECVGTIDSGIVSMSWSPDFEIMLLSTGNSTILSMTSDWDVISEVSVFPKKNPDGTYDVESQDIKDSSEENEPSRLEEATLSWRGDGKFFISNARNPSTGDVVMHVWERSAVHSAACEDCKTAAAVVSWRPSGNIIAANKVSPAGKNEIIFYERNGLRHYEFALKDSPTRPVLHMSWNCDSDILAVHLGADKTSTDSESQKAELVQLWTTSNYRWYLKQELVYPSDLGRIVRISWDQEDGYLLRVATNKGLYFQYGFAWEATISPGNSPVNPSTATVIDGGQLLLTPLRHLVMPPPMSATSITLEGQKRVKSISFSPNFRMLVLCSDGTLALYDIPTSETLAPLQQNSTKANPPNFTAPPKFVATVNLSTDDVKDIRSSILRARSLELINDNTIVGVGCDLADKEFSSSHDYLFQVKLNYESDQNKATASDLFKITAPKRVLRLFHNKDTDTVAIELIDGLMMKFVSLPSSPILTPLAFVGASGSQLPYPSKWIATALMGGKEVVIALDKRNKLYIDGRLASAECNSFYLHNEYLLFTTLTHTMRLVRLKNPFDGNVFETKLNLRSDDTVRDIERGAKLLCVVPHDTRVILQMPRGNLETIAARPLSLSHLRRLLDSKQYRECFFFMRKHRIDLNFIHDHNPTAFFENIKEFVAQINDVTHLNLFLSCLREEDVTKTLFPNPDNAEELSQAAAGSLGVTKGKVNKICQAIREVLQSIDSSKFLLSILTSYVKNSPPELEAVLLVIKELRDKEAAAATEIIDPTVASTGQHTKVVTADEALKYVIFLADVEKLYDVALGMYDFDLATMVAQKSHKDPKEYLPFLNKLSKLETYYQRYSVDVHLEKWASALFNLSKAGEQYFDDCITLMERHKLYSEAIKIYSSDEEKHKTVLSYYADYLLAQGQLEEAGVLFIRCGKDQDALAAFKSATDWKMVLAVAAKLHLGEAEMKEVANEMADTLRNLARFDEAARVYFDYCSDPAQGVSCLIAANQWIEALQMAFKYDLNDAIEEELHPAVLEAYESTNALLDERQQLYEKLHNRLQIVRTNKLLFPKLAVPEGTGDEDTLSLHSEATSLASSLGSRSSYTGSNTSRSSKKSKRRSRKRLTSKEGGPHEEEYLVTTMKNTIPTTKFIEEIGHLLRIMSYFGLRNEGIELQKKLEVFINTVNASTVPLLTSERELNTPPEQTHPPLPASLVVDPPAWKLTMLMS